MFKNLLFCAVVAVTASQNVQAFSAHDALQQGATHITQGLTENQRESGLVNVVEGIKVMNTIEKVVNLVPTPSNTDLAAVLDMGKILMHMTFGGLQIAGGILAVDPALIIAGSIHVINSALLLPAAGKNLQPLCTKGVQKFKGWFNRLRKNRSNAEIKVGEAKLQAL